MDPLLTKQELENQEVFQHRLYKVPQLSQEDEINIIWQDNYPKFHSAHTYGPIRRWR